MLNYYLDGVMENIYLEKLLDTIFKIENEEKN